VHHREYHIPSLYIACMVIAFVFRRDVIYRSDNRRSVYQLRVNRSGSFMTFAVVASGEIEKKKDTTVSEGIGQRW
jgi:hypothetical protein